MHLYAFTRGQKDKVDNFIRDLQAQYFTYKANPHEKPNWIQLGVRPIQFWEFAFPKEHYAEVMRTLDADVLTMKSEGLLRKTLSIIFKIKKFLGLKDCPEWNKTGMKRIVIKHAVDLKAIGIKEDKNAKIELL